jgi:hypothetical protein
MTSSDDRKKTVRLNKVATAPAALAATGRSKVPCRGCHDERGSYCERMSLLPTLQR